MVEPVRGSSNLQDTLATFSLGTRREVTQRSEEARYREAQTTLEGAMKMGSAHGGQQAAQGAQAPFFLPPTHCREI